MLAFGFLLLVFLCQIGVVYMGFEAQFDGQKNVAKVSPGFFTKDR